MKTMPMITTTLTSSTQMCFAVRLQSGLHDTVYFALAAIQTRRPSPTYSVRSPCDKGGCGRQRSEISPRGALQKPAGRDLTPYKRPAFVRSRPKPRKPRK